MKYLKSCIAIFNLAFLVTGVCVAEEFDNSVGFGIQYGGLVGWQGSISQDNLHGRISVGLLGVSLGGDISLNNYVSVGATVSAIAIARLQTININFYPEGKYTSGWRVGLDAGHGEGDFMGKVSGSFVAASFGYSFK